MGLLNKSENWWLRLSLVLFVLITLASSSVINKSVTSERQILIDRIDSLKEECEFKDDQIGKYEMVVYEIQQETPKVVNKVLQNIEGLSYEK
jgi:capsular polysaccharide biosynthesis protein